MQPCFAPTSPPARISSRSSTTPRRRPRRASLLTATMKASPSQEPSLSNSAPLPPVPESDPSNPSAPAPATTGRQSKSHSRPRLSYTADFPTPAAVTLDTIGVIRSPYVERFGTPRQPTVTEHTLGNCAQAARVELFDGRRFEHALRGLADFEYCWVVSFFHLNQGWNPLVTPPRGPRKKQGVFATRSPHRPNSVGLSCVRITGVDEGKRTIHFMGCDLLDGTAVLDIKPYVPYCDAFPEAKAGWLDRLDQDMNAPDKLGYFPPPAHLVQPLSGEERGTGEDAKALASGKETRRASASPTPLNTMPLDAAAASSVPRGSEPEARSTST